ncbi:CCHC-type zinc finger nucleic acid binding protein-like [Halyomorpha halys]|uniref:CCHC-type zinc finger nucleic acid binding protein-like n=1 Tax=Halyomorpha halys TaxID=286706 RepID=UPI0034D1D45F
MRVAYAGTQTAVTLPVLLARKAVTEGKIRVGLVDTQIREKVRLLRCFRCWEFGLLVRRCQGPYRTKCCHKCGEEGHLASDCTKNPSCALCAGKGDNEHSCGGNKCPALHQAL